MSVEITVPSAGESVASGILATWLKGDGEMVSEGDELFELETDKATLAVPAPATGTLKQKAKEGEEVSVGSVVGEIFAGAPAESTDREKEPSPAGGAATPTAESAAKLAGESATKPAGTAGEATPFDGNGAKEAAVLSPAVRRIVDENKLDAASIEGTGKGGRITKGDALKKVEEERARPAAAPAAAAPPAPASPGGSSPQVSPAGAGGQQERVAMSTIRKRIAEHLVRGKQEAAHLTTFNEIDMSNVMALRSRYREAFESKHGIKLGFMSFFIKASCEALAELPAINAYIDGDDIIYNNFYDVGVAVSSDRGLVVPVLRGADKMSFAEIEQQIADKAKRVREKRITVDELSGGTFTITNGGIFGSLLSTPIPNFPQSAILGMHTIQKRPIAVGEDVVVRPMMYVALTYDHRIVDGREAVTFLVRIKEYVENPERLLLEV